MELLFGLQVKITTLTLLVNIVDGVKVIHVGQQHCGFDNCRKQSISNNADLGKL